MELQAVSQSHSAMRLKNHGPVLVVMLLVAGLAAALAAVWNQYRQTHQALDFWGADVAHWIDAAPTVLLISLKADPPQVGASSSLDDIDSRPAIDISQARGLIHFRRGLLEDTNFDWNVPRTRAQSSGWDFAVRFTGPEVSQTILFDLDRGLIANQAAIEHRGALTPKTTRGLCQFFAEQLQSGQ